MKVIPVFSILYRIKKELRKNSVMYIEYETFLLLFCYFFCGAGRGKAVYKWN